MKQATWTLLVFALLATLTWLSVGVNGSSLRSGPATETVVDPDPEESGASGSEDEIVPVQKLEKEVDEVAGGAFPYNSSKFYCFR